MFNMTDTNITTFNGSNDTIDRVNILFSTCNECGIHGKYITWLNALRMVYSELCASVDVSSEDEKHILSYLNSIEVLPKEMIITENQRRDNYAQCTRVRDVDTLLRKMAFKYGLTMKHKQDNSEVILED